MGKRPMKKKTVFQKKKAVSRKKKTVSRPPRPRSSTLKKTSPGQAATLWLMVRDPYWIFAAWEITPKDFEKLKAKMKKAFSKAIRVLRVYDITHLEFNGKNANRSFDIEVGKADNRHIPLWQDGIQCCVEIGLKTKKEEFFPLVRSNTVETPSAHPSAQTEEIWMTVKPSSKKGVHQDLSYSSIKKGKRIYLSREDIRRYYERPGPRLRDLLADRLKASYGKRFDRLRLAGEREREKSQRARASDFVHEKR